MIGVAILLIFNLLGLLVQRWTQVPLPANVIGLILFTTALFLRIVRLEWVEVQAEYLLRHLMLFFAPLVVGAIVFFDLVAANWIAVVGSLVGSWLVVLLVTGWTANLTGASQRSGT
jgi:holin-like protein